MPRGVAHGHRARRGEGRGHHARQFVLVLGGHEGQVGDVPQIGNVECPVMGGPVLAHQAAPVQEEFHAQILQAHVVDDLVVGAL